MHRFLLESEELKLLLETLNITADVDWRQPLQGTECDAIKQMLDNADLGIVTQKVYRETVHCSQWSFDMHKRLSVQNGPHAASPFSVTAPAAYADLPRKNCPKAFVIMAYYDVLLYRCRELWAFGDAGQLIIVKIADSLGPYWQSVLEWPLQVIAAEI